MLDSRNAVGADYDAAVSPILLDGKVLCDVLMDFSMEGGRISSGDLMRASTAGFSLEARAR